MKGAVKKGVIIALSVFGLFFATHWDEFIAYTMYGADPVTAVILSLGLGPREFTVIGMSFSSDSHTLVVSYSSGPIGKGGKNWAALDLTSRSMQEVAPEVCEKLPARPDYLAPTRKSPDGKFVLGNGTEDSPAGYGLYVRPTTDGSLTKIANTVPAYFFLRGRDIIYLTEHVYPAKAAVEAVPNGTYIRAYDLQRNTYIDPETFEPVPTATSRQIILPYEEYASVVSSGPIGLDRAERRILFLGQAATDTLPVLTELKAELAARGEKIAFEDRILFQFDLDNKKFLVHPLIKRIVSDSDLRAQTKSPRMAHAYMTEDGDIYFTVKGIPAVFQFRDGAIEQFVELPPPLDSKEAHRFIVSPDRKWVAFTQFRYTTKGGDMDTVTDILDSSGKGVFEINRKTVKRAACGAARG